MIHHTALVALALTLTVISPVIGHNYVVCTDAHPDMDVLLSGEDRDLGTAQIDRCGGYARAYPAEGTEEAKQYGEQGFPWQGIWPINDGAAFHNRRVCNPLQQDPVYDPSHKEAHVKPESTVLVQVITNNHAHEWKLRQPGRHLIFLAGKSGTQLTTANQLTWDRLVFSAPACKYSHIVGDPPNDYGGFSGDPGYTWLPLKLVDPTGAWLPSGTYNFIFAYFWSTGKPKYQDFMVPSYTSSFDIVISSSANSTGGVPNCNDTSTACHSTLVGNTSCPGGADTTAPWPPYANDGKYLFTNPDGDDPNTANGQRTFQPYWQEFVESTNMSDISYAVTPPISSLNPRSDDGEFNRQLDVGGNVTFPVTLDQVPFVYAGETEVGGKGGEAEGLPVTQVYRPMSVAGVGGGGTQSGNGTSSGDGNETMNTNGGNDIAVGESSAEDQDATGGVSGAGIVEDTAGENSAATEQRKRNVEAMKRRHLRLHSGSH